MHFAGCCCAAEMQRLYALDGAWGCSSLGTRSPRCWPVGLHKRASPSCSAYSQVKLAGCGVPMLLASQASQVAWLMLPKQHLAWQMLPKGPRVATPWPQGPHAAGLLHVWPDRQPVLTAEGRPTGAIQPCVLGPFVRPEDAVVQIAVFAGAFRPDEGAPQKLWQLFKWHGGATP